MRDKLIELLDETFEKQYDRNLVIAARPTADFLIANGVTVQRWIPVSERLPEEWKNVLVIDRYECIESAVYLGSCGKWRVTWNHDFFESPTHWMPLPSVEGLNDT